jgi:hypothetical protein
MVGKVVATSRSMLTINRCNLPNIRVARDAAYEVLLSSGDPYYPCENRVLLAIVEVYSKPYMIWPKKRTGNRKEE